MEEIMRQRQIDRLYHFTQVENLNNIFRYGIIPREILDKRKITSYYNDDYRYDDCMNAVCTSIEFPNYKMFYKLRMDNPETNWAVIRLDAKIMCDFECAYCWTNAGDANVYNTPIEQRMGKNAFKDLFNNRVGHPKREDLHINDWYPTNPQAEVLVFGIIPISYIQDVYFEKESVRKMYREVIADDVPASVNPEVFGPRKDWEAWRN